MLIIFFDNFDYDISYINNNFNNFIDNLKKTDDSIQEIFIKNNSNIKSLKGINNSLCVIIGIEKFMDKLDEEHINIFKEIINHNKNFVFIDVPSWFKKFEYEEWYKNNVDTDDGLWIGSGVVQQYALKILIQPAGIANIENDFGIVLKNGMPTVVKLINEIK